MSEFDFSSFPTLTTARLVLRQVVTSDAADLFSFTSDIEVQRYDSDPPQKDLSEAMTAIERGLQLFASGQAIGWGIELKSEMRLVGGLALRFCACTASTWIPGWTISPWCV
jgi:ribosomal-protein-alanine N-acetyltransferase